MARNKTDQLVVNVREQSNRTDLDASQQQRLKKIKADVAAHVAQTGAALLLIALTLIPGQAIAAEPTHTQARSENTEELRQGLPNCRVSSGTNGTRPASCK